jgi:hypothetical protein
MSAWACPLPGTYIPGVHANCSCNELRALLKRSFGPTPGPSDGARGPVRLAFGRIARVCSRYGGAKWDLRETAESYGGKLRDRYLEAERSLREDGPVGSNDILLRAFLKAEKVHEDKFLKPRMIYPRSPRYNLALASWLKPFEHWLWGNLKSIGTRGVKKSRVVAKGLNGPARANLIRRKFLQIDDCVVFEVDGAQFEAHVDRWQIEQEHRCYEAAFPGQSGLPRLLAHQLLLKGVTAGGVEFAREGGRASGDFNTGMGNSLVMLAIVDSVMRSIGGSQYDTLVDGDNALIFIPRSSLERVVENFHDIALKTSGHEMVLERPVSTLELIRFGQSAPVETRFGWTMVRDWRKVVSTGTSSHAHLYEPKFGRPWLASVGLCESFLARDVPILGKWSERLCSTLEGDFRVSTKMAPHLRDYEYLGVPVGTLTRRKYCAPSTVARESFARAFGVAPEDQELLEALLDSSSPSFEGTGPVEHQECKDAFATRLDGGSIFPAFS